MADQTHIDGIEIDGARIAALLDLEVDTFRRLMADGKIATLCERGTGDDAGRWRATFWHGTKRARLVVDALGRVLGEGRGAPGRGPDAP